MMKWEGGEGRNFTAMQNPGFITSLNIVLPVSASPGTPKLSELSFMKASVELVKVCGESVKS